MVIGDEDSLGSFVFRTTGFNSIRTLAARLHYFPAISGRRLACLPLESHNTPIFYVDLTVRSGSGKCVRGTCRASNGTGIYGMYGQDLSFSLSIYYYIYESEDGYPIAYRMDGGPNKKGKEVIYAQARKILQDLLLDHGISKTSAKDAIAAYSLDANVTSDSSVDDAP